MTPRPAPSRLAIAVDVNPALRQAVTGTELFTREVGRRLPRLAPDLDWVFYASRPGPWEADLTVLPFPRLWSQVRLPVELRSRRPDLFFAPAHVVPFYCPVPALTVIHDLAFERFPDAYGASTRRYLRLTTKWAEKRCPRLITVSESTATDLVDLHGVPRERISVVHPGGGEAPPVADAQNDRDILAQLRIPTPFILHVGRIEPRKNQLAALACAQAIEGMTLVAVGRTIDAGMAARMEATPQCRLLGHVTPEVRDALYRQALALVFPSLYEGFGFPLLEAMGQGLPVVTTRTSSLPEVGGKAAIYADDPFNVRQMAAAVRRLCDDPAWRGERAAAGRRRAKRFTWDRTAKTVADVIRGLIAPKSPHRSSAKSSPPREAM